jgi:hypothetical protein
LPILITSINKIDISGENIAKCRASVHSKYVTPVIAHLSAENLANTIIDKKRRQKGGW